jgi:transaldolase
MGDDMKNNPLRQLAGLGQSIWMDYIRRDLFSDGSLLRRINEDGLKGMTSNPAIFEKAIVDSQLYDPAIRALAKQGLDAAAIYERLSWEDVQSAADAFAQVYAATGAEDGYVSLEVSPRLARDTQGTLEEARRLWIGLHRPNVMIKVPATAQGLPVIRQLVEEGINVNVTLIFGGLRYAQVAEAYLQGLEARAAKGLPLAQVASVASVFVSRLDAMVDPLLDKAGDAARQAKGQVAIAGAKAAYHHYQALFASDRFQALARAGAQPQRVLWASTGTKNPADSDVKYVEALIGPQTVNTVPPETLDAYLDHGKPELRLAAGLAEAQALLQALPGWGIDLAQMEQHLEDEGIIKFVQPFEKLMSAVAQRAGL